MCDNNNNYGFPLALIFEELVQIDKPESKEPESKEPGEEEKQEKATS